MISSCRFRGAAAARDARRRGECPDAITDGDEDDRLRGEPAGEYRLPDRSLLKPSPPVTGDNGVASARIAEQLVRTLSHFGVDATIVGQIAGPRVVRYELQLAPGTKVSKVAGAEGRPLVRTRDDGDPHSRSDPRKAGGRGGGPESLAEARHARRHLRRPARPGEPALGVARQGHLGQRRLDRPRTHASPLDRRHHRVGQVGVHQHASSPRSCFARRRTRSG